MELLRNLIESLGGAIVVVNLVVHAVKAYVLPNLRGRYTQALVLILSIAGGIVVQGLGNLPDLVKIIGEIFAGAVALDQVTALTARGKTK
jgi:hypothetical protein